MQSKTLCTFLSFSFLISCRPASAMDEIKTKALRILGEHSGKLIAGGIAAGVSGFFGFGVGRVTKKCSECTRLKELLDKTKTKTKDRLKGLRTENEDLSVKYLKFKDLLNEKEQKIKDLWSLLNKREQGKTTLKELIDESKQFTSNDHRNTLQGIEKLMAENTEKVSKLKESNNLLIKEYGEMEQAILKFIGLQDLPKKQSILDLLKAVVTRSVVDERKNVLEIIKKHLNPSTLFSAGCKENWFSDQKTFYSILEVAIRNVKSPLNSLHSLSGNEKKENQTIT